jgi:hypothetical protein
MICFHINLFLEPSFFTYFYFKFSYFFENLNSN